MNERLLVAEKRTEARVYEYAVMSHKERTVSICQDICHKCVTRIPIIEESRDDPSNHSSSIGDLYDDITTSGPRPFMVSLNPLPHRKCIGFADLQVSFLLQHLRNAAWSYQNYRNSSIMKFPTW